MTTITIGHRPSSYAEVQELPVGTTLLGSASRRTYTWNGTDLIRDDGHTPSQDAVNRDAGNGLYSVTTMPSVPSVQVGFVPTTRAELEALPVGTMLRHSRFPRRTYEVLGNDQYRRVDSGEEYHGYRQWRNMNQAVAGGRVSVLSLPDTVQGWAGYVVGDAIQRTQVNDLPVGSVVNVPGLHHAVKTGATTWRWEQGQTTHGDRLDEYMAGVYTGMTIVSFGPVEPVQTVPSVGDVIRSTEQVVALPVGSQIDLNGDGRPAYEKDRPNHWAAQRHGGQFSDDGISTNGGHSVCRVGPATVAPRIINGVEFPADGELLTSNDQFAALPVGSVVRCDSRYGRETKIDNDRWQRRDGSRRGTASFSTTGGFRYTLESVGGTTPAAPQFAVGEVLTAEQVEALPVGAVIVNGAGVTAGWRKVGPERWVLSGQDNSGEYTHRNTLLAGWVLLSLPSATPSAPQFEVGQTVDQSVLDHAPIETVVYHPQYNNYRRVESGRWEGTVSRNSFEHDRPTGNLADGRATIRELGYTPVAVAPAALPDNTEVDTAQHIPADADTLTRFKSRFATVTTAKAVGAGVSMEPVRRGLRNMDVPESRPAPGVFVSFYDNPLKDGCPDGTVVEFGKPGDTDYTLFVRQRGYFSRLLGTRDWSTGMVGRITFSPGNPEPVWAQVPATTADGVLIEEFKREAWRQGRRLKSDNSWCGDFERAMGEVGINATYENAETLLSPAEVSALPEGALVQYRHGSHRALYRRDNRAANPARTVKVLGTLDGHWCSEPVTRVTDTQFVALGSVQEMDSMPVGTIVNTRGGRERDGYRKVERHENGRCWQSIRYSESAHESSALMSGDYGYVL